MNPVAEDTTMTDRQWIQYLADRAIGKGDDHFFLIALRPGMAGDAVTLEKKAARRVKVTEAERWLSAEGA